MSDRPPSPETHDRPAVGGGSGSVLVADEQDACAVDERRWQRLVELVLADLDVPEGAEVTLSFVGETDMAALNLAHMGGTGPTDVLSFPIDGPSLGAGSLLPVDGVPCLLGDVVICPAVAQRNAAEHAGTYEDEVALLVVHGLLHLVGHDHAADAEREVMQGAERRLLERHHGPLAADPWRAG